MSIKIEERSLQLALVKAAGRLGVTQDAIGYKVLNRNNGFLGLFGRKVEVEVWKKRDGRRSSGPARASTNDHDQRRELSEKESEALKTDLLEFLTHICSIVSGEKQPNVELIDDHGRLIFDIDNEFLCRQAARNPKLAESLEHLLRKKPRHLRQELPFRVFVDFRGVRRAREDELVDMAQDLSDKVHENKRPIVLNYRSSYDRKIIHMALDKDDRVYTKSIGTGPNRKLMILPSKDSAAEANNA